MRVCSTSTSTTTPTSRSSWLIAATAIATAATVGVTPTAASPVAAIPRSFSLEQTSTPLSKRSPHDLLQWANHHRHGLHSKYGLAVPENTKRAVGGSDLVNFQDDSTWFTRAEFGTPGKSVNMVLDTGSSDIWVVPGDNSYQAASSSTFKNDSSPFQITYGSGQVAGYLVEDTVALAGHSVPGQTFALADHVSQDLLDGTTSGIIGLGFEQLSTSKSEPIWSKSGETEFAFYLERASSSSSNGGDASGGSIPGSGTIPAKRQASSASGVSSSSDTAPGGYFTLGGTNSSLFQGDINWSNVITKGYWLITLGGVTVNNNAVDIGQTTKAAIDTGTTLIGGPDSVIADMYAQIPDSAPVTGASGYYQFPCDSNVNATITFGTQKYSINAKDFRVGQVDSAGQNCMGAFFSLETTSDSMLQWVVGGAFLKSVYSVFRDGNPAQVGFAALANGLDAVGTSSVSVPKTAQASGASSSAAAISASTLALAVSLYSIVLVAI